MLNKDLIVIGAGGHASVLVDVLKQQQALPKYLVSPDKEGLRAIFSGIDRLYHDDDVLSFDAASVCLINGIGSLPGNSIREKVGQHFSAQGYAFKTLVADSAIVSPYAVLGEGVQVMAGAIIQAGARIGDHSIINTGAIVDHDCVIGRYNHIAPGATLSGQVTTGDSVHIGTGACVIQSITIGTNVLVGAGAIVTKSLTSGTKAYGFRSK